MYLLFSTFRKVENVINEDLEKDKKANKPNDVNYYVYTVYKYYLIIVAYTSKIVLLVPVVKQIICVPLTLLCESYCCLNSVNNLFL